MANHKSANQKQKGAALIVMAVLLSLGLMAAFFSFTQPFAFKQQRAAHTEWVLAQAKEALLAYASQPIDRPNCNLNCPRPGDLPCPDMNNDGEAESSCASAQSRLGRLPWKTLGLGDLRDASGERLWYAVSDTYKNNPRILPLNSNTMGRLTVKNAQGEIVLGNEAANMGAVAVILAPMSALTRGDGVAQQRDKNRVNDPKQYLDIAQQEDNSNFVDGQDNGFVMATLNSQFNDVVLPIATPLMQETMQASVLAAVQTYMRDRLCLNKKAGEVCIPTTFPQPSAVNDTSCLGNLTLPMDACQPLSTMQGLGRLPLSADGHWPNVNVSGMLDGNAAHHWFQQNGWREHVFYGRQADSVTIAVGGMAVAQQQRVTQAQQTQLMQYIETNADEMKSGGLTANHTVGNDQWVVIKKP